MMDKKTWTMVGIGAIVVLAIIAFITTVVLLSRKKKEGFEASGDQPKARVLPPPAASPQSGATYQATSQPVLVLFWADWCGPSKAFKPIWDSQIEGKIPGVLTEARESKTLDPSKLGGLVTGYPTMILYPKGFGADTVYDANTTTLKYSGPRTGEAVKDFVLKSTTKVFVASPVFAESFDSPMEEIE